VQVPGSSPADPAGMVRCRRSCRPLAVFCSLLIPPGRRAFARLTGFQVCSWWKLDRGVIVAETPRNDRQEPTCTTKGSAKERSLDCVLFTRKLTIFQRLGERRQHIVEITNDTESS
jgi:hypothetical protein